MKKHLLILTSLFLGAQVNAQFTQANEPQIGDATALYVIDSAAVNYENITGNGVTWDYSGYAGYGNIVRTINVTDPTQTANGALFPNATKTLEIQDFLFTYISSTPNERISHGFVFTEPSFGDIVAVLDSVQQTQYTYPFDLNDSQSDTYIGEVFYNFQGAQSSNTNGTITSEIDGVGTLMLANGVEFQNVRRYKVTEQTTIEDVPILPPLVAIDIILERVQYEYYSVDQVSGEIEPLPIFVHSSGELKDENNSTLFDYNLVLSLIDPQDVLNTQEITHIDEAGFKLYPNPAQNSINIKTNAQHTDAYVEIFDALGRSVKQLKLNEQTTKIDISGFNRGIYIAKINSANTTETIRFVKK